MVEGRGVDRQTCHRAISLDVGQPAGRRHMRLAFASHAGEQIVLDLTTVGEPDPQRGGVSNPGNHSPNTSLPVMRRGASTLAGPDTEVRIDGKRFDVPVKARSGPFVAHEGYYTERHLFAAIRAGTVTQRVKARPDRIGVGVEWIFEGDGRQTTYRVVACASDGQLRIVNPDDPGEIITASPMGEGLVVSRISRVTDEGTGLDLTFGENGGFGLSIDGECIVTGSAETTGDMQAAAINLCPAEPDWAVIRQVRIACTREADLLTFVTTIGASASPLPLPLAGEGKVVAVPRRT